MAWTEQDEKEYQELKQMIQALPDEDGHKITVDPRSRRERFYGGVNKLRGKAEGLAPYLAEHTPLSPVPSAMIGMGAKALANVPPASDLETGLMMAPVAGKALRASKIGTTAIPNMIQRFTGKELGAIRSDIYSKIRPFNPDLKLPSSFGGALDEAFQAINKKKDMLAQELEIAKFKIKQFAGDKPVTSTPEILHEAEKIFYNPDTEKTHPIFKTIKEILTRGSKTRELPFHTFHAMKQELQDLVHTGIRTADDRIIKPVGEEARLLAKFISGVNKKLETFAQKETGSSQYTQFNREYSDFMDGATEIFKNIYPDYPRTRDVGGRFSSILFEGANAKRNIQGASEKIGELVGNNGRKFKFFDVAREGAISTELSGPVPTRMTLNPLSLVRGAANMLFKPSTQTGMARSMLNPTKGQVALRAVGPSVLQRMTNPPMRQEEPQMRPQQAQMPLRPQQSLAPRQIGFDPKKLIQKYEADPQSLTENEWNILEQYIKQNERPAE